MNVIETAYTHGEESVGMNCYTNLPASGKVAFVNTVMGIILRDCYYPMLRNLAFDYALVSMFTDVNVDEYKTIDEIEILLGETNIADIVRVYAEEGVIDELENAVAMNIEYKTGIHENQIEKSLAGLLSVLGEKIPDIKPEGLAELTNMITKMSGELTPDKLVESYANSDLFQKRYQDAVAEKAKKKGGTRSKKSANLKVVQ